MGRQGGPIFLLPFTLQAVTWRRRQPGDKGMALLQFHHPPALQQ